MQTRFHKMLDRVFEIPIVARQRISRFDADFRAGGYGGSCRGVFATYAECAAAAPESRPLGYDNDDAAAMYRDRLDKVYPGDYPMIHWLGRAFESGSRRVFDLGGHVGIAYYAYRRYLDYPASLSWQVHDVAAVMASGRRLAGER